MRGRTVLDEASARDARFRVELQAAIEASPAPVLLRTLLRNSHHPPQGQGVDGHPACPAALRDWQRRAHALPAWEADVARDCGEGPLLAWIHAQRTDDVERKRALLRAAYDADAAPLRAPARADDIIREVAANNNVPYVDLAELEGGVQPGRWFFDPLHTTEEGARAMAAALAPAVRAALPTAP